MLTRGNSITERISVEEEYVALIGGTTEIEKFIRDRSTTIREVTPAERKSTGMMYGHYKESKIKLSQIQ